jgi:hypothetical protein
VAVVVVLAPSGLMEHQPLQETAVLVLHHQLLGHL